MFARKPADGEQPLLGLFQLNRVKSEAFDRFHNPIHGIVKLDQRTPQRRQGGLECPFSLCRRTIEPAHGVSECGFRTLMAKRLMGPDHVSADFLGTLHEPAPLVQFRVLSRLRCQCVDLSNGVTEELLLFPHHCQRRFCSEQSLGGSAFLRPGGLHSRSQL